MDGDGVKYTSEEIEKISVDVLIDRGIRFGLSIPINDTEEDDEDLY